MTLIQTVKVLTVVSLLAVGQILFKLAATQIRPGSARDTLLALAFNPYLLVGVAIYGLTTVLWVLVLREVPLSRAYPLTALAMLIVPLVGLVAFREPFSWSLIGGGVLLIAGAYLIALR
jgi:drug/metabolite transporter (DMT)-like permease